MSLVRRQGPFRRRGLGRRGRGGRGGGGRGRQRRGSVRSEFTIGWPCTQTDVSRELCRCVCVCVYVCVCLCVCVCERERGRRGVFMFQRYSQTRRNGGMAKKRALFRFSLDSGQIDVPFPQIPSALSPSSPFWTGLSSSSLFFGDIFFACACRVVYSR